MRKTGNIIMLLMLCLLISACTSNEKTVYPKENDARALGESMKTSNEAADSTNTFDDLLEATMGNNIVRVKELLNSKTDLFPEDSSGNVSALSTLKPIKRQNSTQLCFSSLRTDGVLLPSIVHVTGIGAQQ